MGERRPCKAEAVGSTPIISTNTERYLVCVGPLILHFAELRRTERGFFKGKGFPLDRTEGKKNIKKGKQGYSKRS
jgi:hypothetical protein